MKKLNSLIVLMFFLTSVFSKTVTVGGIVSDSMTNKGIPNHAVYLKQISGLQDSLNMNSKILNTLTDINGFYTFKAEVSDSIQVMLFVYTLDCNQIQKGSDIMPDSLSYTLNLSICFAGKTDSLKPSCRAAFYIEKFNLKDSLTQNSVPNTFNFVNVSIGNITDYTWDFGDGFSSVNPFPINTYHSYSNSGNYNVCLTISAGNACNDKICQNISVNTNTTTFKIDPLTPDSIINNNKTWTVNVDSLIAPPVDTCVIDYSKPIESAMIDSIHVIDQNNVNVDWIIKQYVDSIHINTTYNFNTPGTNMFYLTVQCNSNTKSAAHSNTFVDQYNVSVPTGISNVQNKISVSTYPNPTSDKFTIEMDNQSSSYNLIIYNMTGQIILDKKLSNKVEHVDLSMQASGIYFLKLQSTNNTIVKKLIKN